MGLIGLTDTVACPQANESGQVRETTMPSQEQDTTTVDVTPILTNDQWNNLLTRVVAPELGKNLRRGTRRYPVMGEAKLTYEKDGRNYRRTFDVINVSRGGLTLKGYDEVKADTLIDVKVTLGPHVARLKAKVVHCTGTLGGHKVGIEIIFSK